MTFKEFTCILVWKANRSKPYTINKIEDYQEKHKLKSMSQAVEQITYNIYKKEEEFKGEEVQRQQLSYLIKDVDIPLATSSAILAVLYPDLFPVYDTRVSGVLDKDKRSKFREHSKLKNKTNSDNIWEGYKKYREGVKNTAKKEKTLRDMDKWLWGKSLSEKLDWDIEHDFKEPDTK